MEIRVVDTLLIIVGSNDFLFGKNVCSQSVVRPVKLQSVIHQIEMQMFQIVPGVKISPHLIFQIGFFGRQKRTVLFHDLCKGTVITALYTEPGKFLYIVFQLLDFHRKYAAGAFGFCLCDDLQTSLVTGIDQIKTDRKDQQSGKCCKLHPERKMIENMIDFFMFHLLFLIVGVIPSGMAPVSMMINYIIYTDSVQFAGVGLYTFLP